MFGICHTDVTKLATYLKISFSLQVEEGVKSEESSLQFRHIATRW